MPASIRSSRSRPRPTPTTSFDTNPNASPTLTATTLASRLDLGDDGPKVIVTRADLRDSISAYEHLLSTAKGYRNALIALSTASTALAGALGECARVKGAEDTSAENLMAASGLQYMVANSGQVLSDTLYRSFEVPLMTQYDSYVNEIAARHAEYEELLKEKTARIRETEAENMRRGKKKTRDLDQFRQALHQLTEQVAEVEVCKRTYYSEVLDGESQMWAMIAGKVALLVRSTLDLSDRLASKSTSDPVIESMLNEHPDPFDSYRLDRDEADVLTVLPPINLVGSASTPVISPGKSGNGTALATVLETEQSFQADADERDESERSALPQRLARTPVSVFDILGLREPDEASRPPRLAEALHEESPHNKQDAETPPRVGRSRSRSGSHLPTPSSTSTPNSTATESPALEHSLSRSESFDEPPSLTIESAPFVPPEHVAAVETPTKPVRSGPNESVDSEDPMAGDWGAPIYGRSLSMHDGPEYDSGDDY
ncbi:hypothetical protein BMF94_2274 [Rhodotorula taiwanensis]|uniref:IMD domain-containing protein n=1 Tax=Rhodotorula taiwanensis TaxID=741276 RepID=A0A2S5BCL3_9BASI|nr:hypothetical protein BMF94_2274 [Rhodotorula taiwanensis]